MDRPHKCWKYEECYIFENPEYLQYLLLEDENFIIRFALYYLFKLRFGLFKLIIRGHLFVSSFFTYLSLTGATSNSMSNFKIRKRRLRDFLLVAKFHLVDPRLRTTGATKPLFPEIRDKSERLNGKNERAAPCYSLIRINENLHLLDLRLFPLQMANNSTVRSVHTPSFQTQLLSAFLRILFGRKHKTKIFRNTAV